MNRPNGEEPRFAIPSAAAARTYIAAVLAAKQLRSLQLYVEGYQRLLAGEADAAGAPRSVELKEAYGRQAALFDQLSAFRAELLVLAAEAKQSGTETLKELSMTAEPKVDLLTKLEIGDPAA